MTIKSASLLEGYYIEQTAKQMKLGFSQKLLQLGIDVTVDQWIVIDTLAKTPKLSQLELARSTSKDAPTITRILDRLSEKALIDRQASPKDRRKHIIALTSKGNKIYKKIVPYSTAFRSKCYQGLSVVEIKTLKKTLNTIAQNLKK